MPRRALSAAAVSALAALAVAGCGGSTSASSSPSATASTTAASTAARSTRATYSVSGEGTPTTVTVGPTKSSASTTAPEAPTSKAPKHSKPIKPDTEVRIPAAFVIESGGTVTPPSIALPPNVRIELQLTNHDGKPHQVMLSVPHFTAVTVPAKGRKTTDLTGAPNGTYALSIDGTKRATVVVGSVPGP